MKKILAVVLALSLVFSAMAVMPTKAYAAENDADTSIAKKHQQLLMRMDGFK